MIKPYYLFLKRHFEPVFFGWLLTFFSSFGQTFLISLFVPFILADLVLTKTEFGGYYAIATIIASLLLLRFGHIIDDRPIRPFTNATLLLTASASLLLALVWHPAVLFFALVGLRLGGQGLMSHISMSIMSRYFTKNRGKALSISSLGYSFGEMVFPMLMGVIITLGGWRISAAAGSIILLILMYFLRYIHIERMDTKPTDSEPEDPETVKNAEVGKSAESVENVAKKNILPLFNFNKHSSIPSESDKKISKPGKRAFYKQMLKESRFWVISPPSFMLSFTITGFFFYQYIMAEVYEWPIGIYTMLFAGYGVVRFFFSLYGGLLTDRYSAKNLYIFQLVPMILGILSLSFMPGISAAVTFLGLCGITLGVGSVVKPAIIAEIYGVERIGMVRSLYTVIMVISTALAPLIFGLALDAGYSFEFIGQFVSVILIIITLHTLRLYKITPSV